MQKKNFVKLCLISVSTGLIFSACGGGNSDASKEILLLKDFRKMYPTLEDYEKAKDKWVKCRDVLDKINGYSKQKTTQEENLFYLNCLELRFYLGVGGFGDLKEGKELQIKKN